MMIQLALKSPEVQIDALTTVFGNSVVNFTTRNALINLEVADRADIPVACGAAKPLVRPYTPGKAEQVHGRDGLGNSNLPDPQCQALATPAAMLIVERVMQNPGDLTLLATGPLTNLALALSLEPRISERVRDVVIMGGIIERDLNSPIAETNIRNDPEAARIVFRAGWPLTMVPLDVTLKTEMGLPHLERIRKANTRVTTFLSEITPVYLEWCQKRYNREAMKIHDSAALAYILDPSLFQTQKLNVDIEVHGELTSGQTVVDLQGNPDKIPNVTVCLDVDSDGLVEMHLERITS
jgi:inosine-uridine nucleoside N-ribohydrolase